MKTLTVKTPSKSYPITIGSGLFDLIADYIGPLAQAGHVFVIADQALEALYIQKILERLTEARINCIGVRRLPSGEHAKSFSELEKTVNAILDAKPERKTLVIGLGGGVTGDHAGFAASMVLRGLPFVQIPTSLLAQVDSSVGGKTGINTEHGKNLIGSFYQPEAVLIDTDCLKTLPKRELLAGYAEVVKYGFIRDREFFEWLQDNLDGFLEGRPEIFQEMIYRSCQHKAVVVAADEKEQGERALLNFGHTFGHTLEAFDDYRGNVLHGEAVAIGMMLAFKLSVEMKLCPQSDLEKAEHFMRSAGLPVRISDIEALRECTPQHMIKYMQHDKKIEKGQIRFILARGIGEAFIEKNVDSDILMAVLQDACSA